MNAKEMPAITAFSVGSSVTSARLQPSFSRFSMLGSFFCARSAQTRKKAQNIVPYALSLFYGVV